MSSTSTDKPLRLAIIDDYSGIAIQHFQHIPNLHIDCYPHTLNLSLASDRSTFLTQLQPYDIISSMRERTPFPSSVLDGLPNLKLLLNASGRNASIDMAHAASKGIIVAGTKGDVPSDPAQRGKLPEMPPPAGHSTVVQHAWAQLLAMASRIVEDDYALKGGEGEAWQSGFMIGLAGKTLGIVGLGKLGVGMAKIGVQSFGMRVIAWSEHLTQAKADEAAVKAGLEKGVFEAVGREEFFRQADVVSLHNVLSDRSRGMVGEREFGWMKSSAFVVNTSRGPLIDERALIEVLKRGGIKGVALDVFDLEPLPKDSPWRTSREWSKSQVLLSPHMGYGNAGTMNRWYQEQAENVERWIRGEEVLNRMN